MAIDDKFKKLVWGNTQYFMKLFKFKDREFFIPKDAECKNSNRFYISDNSIKKWAWNMTDEYDNKPKYALYKTLLEKRRGQYSNGTLYSSSRLISEIFAIRENRAKLLKHVGIENFKPGNFKWYLEYQLPIENVEGSGAHLDLVAENDNYFIGVECKMKEIYADDGAGYYQDFKVQYKDNGIKDVLKEFDKEFAFKRIGDVYRYYLKNNNEDENTKCNFYYKQQICHLLGMQSHKDIKNKEFILLNFVFDPSDLDDSDSEINRIFKQYKDNEKLITGILKKCINDDVKYAKLLTQKILKSKNS